MPGKFIAIYGINNIGKSTQAKLLAERLEKEAHPSFYLKYPIYDLPPSGPMINDYLSPGNPLNLSPLEAQLTYTLNRTQHEPVIKEKLAAGTSVVAEDYKGTGWAWGIGTGVSKDVVIKINTHLLQPDLEILLDGEPFGTNREQNHKNEGSDELLAKVRQIHLDLAPEFGWKIVPASDSVETVREAIYKLVRKLF